MKRKIIILTLCVLAVSSFSVFASGTNEVCGDTYGIGYKWASNAVWAPATFSLRVEAPAAASVNAVIPEAEAETSDNTIGIGVKWASNAEWAPATFSTKHDGLSVGSVLPDVVKEDSNLPDFL